MSRFAPPLVPGQLAGPSQEAVQGIGMAGQFAQRNLDRGEEARQANMADSTRRAGMTQQERMEREAQAAQERQAGLQRSHEQGMQTREFGARQQLQTQELDARSRLQQQQMRMQQREAERDRRFQMDMEERVRRARQEDTVLEREAWVAGVEARAGKRDAARAKRAERLKLESDLAAARVETERGDREVGEAKTRAIEYITGNAERADAFWKRGKAAGSNAIAKLGLDASDLQDMGFGLDDGHLVSIDALTNAKSLGLGKGDPGLMGLGQSASGVTGDVEAAKAKLMRKAAEHVARSIASAGGPASAADADVVDAVHEFMTKAAAARGSEAAGTPAKLDDLKAILDRVGSKVSATELYAAFDGMGEQAEAQALNLKTELLKLQDASGNAPVTAQTLRLALQLQTMEALAGIDNAANLALGGKVDHPEMWLSLKERLMNRVRPDELDADSLVDLLDVNGGKWKGEIAPLIEQGGDLYGLIDAAERQKGRMGAEEGLSKRRATALPQIEEDLMDLEEDSDIEGARTELETLKRLLTERGR